MNDFEQGLLRYLRAEELAKIRLAKIGIAGAGGLGSNVAISLVRSGFINFEIIDKDVIDASNLNRQYYFLDEIGLPKVVALSERMRKINPAVEVKDEKMILTESNALNYFQTADIIFEAFDGAENKKMFLEAYGNSGKLLIMGSGMAGLSNAREIKIRKVSKNIYIVGDEQTNVNPDHPPFAPRVTACAGLMASVALEHTLWEK